MFSPISSCYTNTVGHVSGPGLKCIHFLVIEDHPVSLPNCPGGSPSQLLWKERCWRPLYFSFLRTVQITNPRIYHCIQYSTVSDAFHLTRISPEIRPFPSHLKLSFKDLMCTISTFQGKNCLKCLERTLRTEKSSILLTLFLCLKAQEDLPSVPWIEKSTGTRLSATLAWLMGSTVWLFTSNAQLAIHWMKNPDICNRNL